MSVLDRRATQSIPLIHGAGIDHGSRKVLELTSTAAVIEGIVLEHGGEPPTLLKGGEHD